MSETMAVQEHLYDAAAQLAEPIDFGLDLRAVMSGGKPIPAEGLRLNYNFQAELTGPKLKGKMVGTDYFLLRADGLGIVNAQAVLTTVEGDRIAYHADGITNSPPQGSTVVQVRENVTFHTANPKYSWINHVLCRVTGTIDLATGKGSMKGYTA